MNKVFVLIKREYLIRVKTKGFIFGTLFLPLFVLFIGLIPVLLGRFAGEGQKQIAVIDLSQRVFNPLDTYLNEIKTDNEGQPLYQLERIETDPGTLEAKKSSLNEQVEKGEWDVFLVIPEDVFTSNQFELYAKNVSNFDFNATLENAVSNVVSVMRLNESGLDHELIDRLIQRVQVKTFKVDEAGAKEESSMASFWISYVMVFLLYMVLIFYGQFVMRGVIEDKVSRVIEVVLSSVKPYQMMAGKIIGIGSVGLTQFLIWIGCLFFISSYGTVLLGQMGTGFNITIPSLSIWVFLSFILYFLLGYFLYAALYAAMGSMASSESDAQNLQWPAVSMIILSFMLMLFVVVRDPTSTLSVVLSLVPFFSPILMFTRISVNSAPLNQVILSIVLSVVMIIGLIWIGGRIFRVGILMYGKRANLKEAIKWIRYS
ncbi:ABC transporter permease [bacterium]|nr:ABC transporter permease [bacterium]